MCVGTHKDPSCWEGRRYFPDLLNHDILRRDEQGEVYLFPALNLHTLALAATATTALSLVGRHTQNWYSVKARCTHATSHIIWSADPFATRTPTGIAF